MNAQPKQIFQIFYQLN